VKYPGKTVQVTGTFGASGTITIEGSNDGITYATLRDPSGTPLVISNTSIYTIAENTRFMRARAGGTGGTLDVHVMASISASGGGAGTAISQATPGTSNAVAMEAQYLTTPPTYTNGTVNLLQMTSRGALYGTLLNQAGSPISTGGSTADATAAFATPISVVPQNMYFNGTTWDRQRGDTNGAFSVSKGSSNLATNQVSVGTSATQIVPARAGRGAVTITNLGTNDVWLGVSGVTVGNGHLLLGAKGSSVTIPTNAAVFGIAGVAQSVSFLETY
jgi:hypothetical protein